MKRKFAICFVVACAALFCSGLAACNKKPDDAGGTGGEEPPKEERIAVTDYMLDNERKFTGTLVDGKPEGEGALEWVLTNCFYTGNFENGLYSGEGKFEWKNDGNTFVGTFENNEPKEGKFTYANTMSYTGTFKNWQFDGRGTFDWNRYNPDGTLYDAGWLYEGEFKKGTIAGCTGKLTMKRSGNDAAVYWFEGEMSGFPAIKRDQQGRGFIRYPDKSTYEGEIYYSASGEWLRKGEGVMDFTQTSFKGSSAGGLHADKLLYYRGQFDAGVTGWMYGDGVMYFCNPNGLEPTGYIKGSWRGMTRTGDWQGEWKDETLLEAWRGTQEIEWKHEFNRKLEGYVAETKDVDFTGKTLLLGSSSFEFWRTSKQDLLPEYDSYNFGIGGSTVKWWSDNFDLLNGIKGVPEHILIFCGGNDITAGYSAEQVVENYIAFLVKLRAKFPTSQINIVANHTSWVGWATRESVKALNRGMKAYADTAENVYFLDIYGYVYSDSAVSNYYDADYGYLRKDVWQADNLHLNSTGYVLFKNAIKNALAEIEGGKA